MATKTREVMRTIRHKRIRKRVRGTAERPRLCVYRSLRHIIAQAIDDEAGVTLAHASSLEKDVEGGGAIAGAVEVGRRIAERLKEKGIRQVVFDRGGYRYAGRVAALADSARKAGLEF